MSAAAYYNEIDPFAAQWLRNLIAAGHIAPGEVDERSIEDVTPDDLRGFTQCHFFAGIGVWSHSLRLAGWPDDRPVWTGSCPCQPFSAAGKGDGFTDERHLWPHFFHLISECRPQHVFGEQVAAGNANVWFDLVQADLEGMGYAFGLVPFTSAGIGAPHIRERAYWVVESAGEQCQKLLPGLAQGVGAEGSRSPAKSTGFCSVGSLDNADKPGLEGHFRDDGAAGREGTTGPAAAPGVHDGMAHSYNGGYRPIEALRTGRHAVLHGSESVRPLEVNGFWRDADWLLCRDGKWRPVEPGTFPLVNGASSRLVRKQPGVAGLARMASSNRTGRLKGYGNAINAQAAAAFIRAYMGVA
ncbi:DNA cytosine methyltransferase [Klebsiella pneumoniae]|uniref:DNA cytosine methyltransferase n=1 Tax=Klebsiella pneumoniae TaxID=573 RepID=UPI00190529D9|nr:DNA cytosine methyltransferase [Klebsiella pneumoniae]MBK0546982.1 DNA cytosine methyltransferase [Klebsiella pneumoniae]